MEVRAMALEENDQATRLQPVPEFSEPRSDRAFPQHAVRAKDAPPQALRPDGREGLDSPVREAEREAGKHSGDERDSGRPRRRRPFAVPIAIVLAASVAAGGYLYWDNARRFETTDDAFI